MVNAWINRWNVDTISLLFVMFRVVRYRLTKPRWFLRVGSWGMTPIIFRAILALSLFSILGCVDDSEQFTLGEPSLSLLGTGGCGRNSAPVAEDGSGTVTITVTGRDPRTPTGDLRSGTTVKLDFADEADLATAYFRSSENSTELTTSSGDLPFSGSRARDEVVCFREGTVSVIATITDYAIDADGDEARTVELKTGPFPIRCLSAIDYNRECSGLPLIDSGIDFGGADDMGVDAADADRPPAWSIRFLPPENETDLEIGIKDSAFGRPDNLLLRFQVIDLSGTTSADGDALANLPVTFSLSDNPPPNVAIEPAMGQTDENGIVAVRLNAGGTPGVVTVLAQTTIGEGGPLTARSATVVIRGGIPSASGFQFLCEDPVIAAFTARPSWDNYQFGIGRNDFTTCVAQLSDRVAGRVDIATQVFFLTEAGSVDQASTTDENGIAVTSLRIGPPAPYEIVEIPANGYEADADQRYLNSDFNPRDGLVTVVAVTRGEEDFVDVNGNKVWDEFEDYQLANMDLAEPCIDANDDGECQVDLDVRGDEPYAEAFRDTNNDGIWSDGNGTWDKDTEIWQATHVLWTGLFDRERSLIQVECQPGDQCYLDPASELCRIPGIVGDEGTYFLGPGGRITVRARFNDTNGNCLDAYGEGETYVEVDGSLEEVRGLTQNDIRGECFLDSIPTQPRAPTHTYEFADTSGLMVEEAQLSTIRVGVRYRTLNGTQRDEFVTFHTCR